MKKFLFFFIVFIFMGTDEVISQWNANGNNIYNTNTGFVGIGNNSPATLLHVQKDMTEPMITVQNLGGAGGATYNMVDAVSGANWKFKATGTGGFKIRDHANLLDVLVIEPNSMANSIYINGDGHIGLGTANPLANLQMVVGWGTPYAGIVLSSLHPDGKSLSINQGTAGKFNFTNPGVIDLVTMDFNENNVGIKTLNPDPSAALEVQSSTQGFLPPRMSLAQMVAISNPANGLIVFNTTDDKFYAFIANENKWKELLFGTGTVNMDCPPFTVNHATTGGVAPVNKTVNYGTVTEIPGEPTKCWITQNLGADHQAVSVDDATEASAGWYWQFNHLQGYKHDGTTLTPSWTITSIFDNSDWTPANDPCTAELGSGWRLPTFSEWANVDGYNAWVIPADAYNSGLKLHLAGYLDNMNGALFSRGFYGYYWSSAQIDAGNGWNLVFYNSEFENACIMSDSDKARGQSARCLK